MGYQAEPNGEVMFGGTMRCSRHCSASGGGALSRGVPGSRTDNSYPAGYHNNAISAVVATRFSS